MHEHDDNNSETLSSPADPIDPEPGTRTPEPDTRTPKRRTPLGTPCSPLWDDAHIAKVEALELQLNRPVCGARNLAGHPCALEPCHANGRCRFHGGFNLTGAQPGNRNGVIHGLYARSIQTCGDHCPMWKSCPCANPDVLELDPRDRPKCPYETAQYNASLSDALARVDSIPCADAMTRHAAHQYAMLQVMTMRASGAMAVNPMSDVVLSTGREYKRTDRRVSVYAEAFLRLSRELRRYAKQLETDDPNLVGTPVAHAQKQRASIDTSLLPEDQASVTVERVPKIRRANAALRDALAELKYGKPKRAQELLDEAMQIEAHYIEGVLDPAGSLWDGTFEQLLPLINAP